MAKFNQFVSDLSTTGKGVACTYDDNTEREVFVEEFSRLWPEWNVCLNPKMHACDLSAYDSQNNIKAFIELDRAGQDWQKIYWNYLSILERKEENMLMYNREAPVLMVWINQSMSKYCILNLREVNILDYPLQKIPYKKNRNKTIFEHPFDFHRRIPLKFGTLRTTGE